MVLVLAKNYEQYKMFLHEYELNHKEHTYVLSVEHARGYKKGTIVIALPKYYENKNLNVIDHGLIAVEISSRYTFMQVHDYLKYINSIRGK